MVSQSRYDLAGRTILNVSLVLLLAGVLQAQINGPRASVNSLGGQFTIFNPPGPRASVTSLGPNGWGWSFCCRFPRGPVQPGFSFHHRHRGNGLIFGGGYPLYVMPYYYPADIVEPVDDSMEHSYAPGPTIFDRRSSALTDPAYQHRLDQRVSRLEEQIDEAEQATPSKSAPHPEPPIPVRDQPDTILVFNDGHTIAVKNYAIVGETLYDYSGDTRRKIDLADLNLPATQKTNEDHGIDFRLPTRVSAR
jgi:hypothetical protein